MLCVKIILLFVALFSFFDLFCIMAVSVVCTPASLVYVNICQKVSGASKINAFFLVCLLQIHYFCHSNKQSVNLNFLNKYHYGSTENHARPGAQASW